MWVDGCCSGVCWDMVVCELVGRVFDGGGGLGFRSRYIYWVFDVEI